MESTLPCPKCGRDLYGQKKGPRQNPYIRYFCPSCGEGWNEATLDQEARDADFNILRGSRDSDPRGDTGGIPNSDGYP